MPEDQVQDDPTIPDDAILIRRVPYYRWKFEENRPDSRAFDLRKRKKEEYLSVYLKSEVKMEDVLTEYLGEGFPGIALLGAGDIRELNLGFVLHREPQDSHLAGHCGIYGQFTRANRKRLREISQTLSAPRK